LGGKAAQNTHGFPSRFAYPEFKIINKHVTNKVMIHISGKEFGHFAILSHVGRKRGRLQQIPIIAEPVGGGFVIALTYRKEVDWYKNVVANNNCDLLWKRND